jgi:hypothetical protein
VPRDLAGLQDSEVLAMAEEDVVPMAEPSESTSGLHLAPFTAVALELISTIEVGPTSIKDEPMDEAVIPKLEPPASPTSVKGDLAGGAPSPGHLEQLDSDEVDEEQEVSVDWFKLEDR